MPWPVLSVVVRDGELKYIHVAWIPAIHAGMTGFNTLVYNDESWSLGTSTGLIIELILGFSLFLDGRNLGWRISLLGILVGCTAIVAAYVEEYIWVVLLVSLCLWGATYYWEKHRHKDL